MRSKDISFLAIDDKFMKFYNQYFKNQYLCMNKIK